MAATPLLAAPLTQRDRDFAMSLLHSTRKQFLDSIAGVSDAQWRFKPAPDRWSVAETAEHIAVSEEFLGQLVMVKLAKAPAMPDKTSAMAGQDEKLAQMLMDRSQRFQAPEMIRPTNRWPTREALAEQFRKSRDGNIAYVQTTQDDLRSRFMDHPVFKTLDAYQWMILLAGHSGRHTAQINEVKADAGFPKG